MKEDDEEEKERGDEYQEDEVGRGEEMKDKDINEWKGERRGRVEGR